MPFSRYYERLSKNHRPLGKQCSNFYSIPEGRVAIIANYEKLIPAEKARLTQGPYWRVKQVLIGETYTRKVSLSNILPEAPKDKTMTHFSDPESPELKPEREKLSIKEIIKSILRKPVDHPSSAPNDGRHILMLTPLTPVPRLVVARFGRIGRIYREAFGVQHHVKLLCGRAIHSE